MLVSLWVVSWLNLIADGLYLDRCDSRICYGVGVYYTPWALTPPNLHICSFEEWIKHKTNKIQMFFVENSRIINEWVVGKNMAVFTGQFNDVSVLLALQDRAIIHRVIMSFIHSLSSHPLRVIIQTQSSCHSFILHPLIDNDIIHTKSSCHSSFILLQIELSSLHSHLSFIFHPLMDRVIIHPYTLYLIHLLLLHPDKSYTVIHSSFILSQIELSSKQSHPVAIKIINFQRENKDISITFALTKV